MYIKNFVKTFLQLNSNNNSTGNETVLQKSQADGSPALC